MAKPMRTAKPKKKPSDFKHPKRKLGHKAMGKRKNLTRVDIKSRRLELTEQSALQDKLQLARSGASENSDALAWTHRHLTLGDLLKQLSHYNAFVRQKALQGIEELIKRGHGAIVLANIAIVLEKILPLFLDSESIVREALIVTWRHLLAAFVSGSSKEAALQPFSKFITITCCSGMTHIQTGIRQHTFRAIESVLEVAPKVVTEWTGIHALCKLIETFSDLISSVSTQGYRIRNQYSVLHVQTSTQNRTADGGKKEQKRAHTKLLSGGLALRFAALSVLLKLLNLANFSPNESEVNQFKASAGRPPRSTSIDQTHTLLVYPSWHTSRERETAQESKHQQLYASSLILLASPLHEIWMESLADQGSAISDVYLKHMNMIVQCLGLILESVTALLKRSKSFFINDKNLTALRDITRDVLRNFPLTINTNLASQSESHSSQYYDINVSLCRTACVYRNLCRCFADCKSVSNEKQEDDEELDEKIPEFLVQVLENIAEMSAESNVKSLLGTLGMYLRIQGNSECTGKEISSKNTSRILAAFTHLYVKCEPNTTVFRKCTEFALGMMAAETGKCPSLCSKLPWQMMLQWIKLILKQLTISLHPLLNSIAERYTFLFNQCVHTFPPNWAEDAVIDSYQSLLTEFFDLTSPHKASRFVDLNFDNQMRLISGIYHLPAIPNPLLRNLAKCCRESRMSIHSKTFLLDVLLLRSEILEPASLFSFLMTAVFRDSERDSDDGSADAFGIVQHTYQILLRMKLGHKLGDILVPLLTTQARALLTYFQNVENEEQRLKNWNLRTLLLMYSACLDSAKQEVEPLRSQRVDVAEFETFLLQIIRMILFSILAIENGASSQVFSEVLRVLSAQRIMTHFVEDMLQTQDKTHLIQRFGVISLLYQNDDSKVQVMRFQSVIQNHLNAWKDILRCESTDTFACGSSLDSVKASLAQLLREIDVAISLAASQM